MPLDEVLVADQSGRTDFEPETILLSLEGVHYPLFRFAAQRGGSESALRFRWLSGDVSLCDPDFGETAVN